MVINGVAWEGPPPDLPPEKLEYMYDWFEERISEYTSSYRKERNREAEAVVNRQLQSLEASYTVKRRRREQAIETSKAANRSERIIQLQVSQANKLKADYEVKRAELSERRGVNVSYRIEGVGFVKVSS